MIVEKRWKSRWLDPSEVNALQSFVGTVIDVLKPKAVFSVGCCAGFQKANTNLGDVVISAKLSTTGDKKIVCDEQQSDSRRLDVRILGTLLSPQLMVGEHLYVTRKHLTQPSIEIVKFWLVYMQKIVLKNARSCLENIQELLPSIWEAKVRILSCVFE